jgi:signal transduction histidine kinase
MNSPVTLLRVLIAVVTALSTYWLRFVFAPVGLQGITFLVPVLVAAYFLGSRLAALAAAMSISVAHAILWTENPAALFTRPYAVGIFNFVFFSTLITLYTHRHERVLSRLDDSLKREQAARQDAEAANRLKDQFLATLSHELRTPINVILGYLQILLAERTGDPRRALEIVHRNAQQQARLIEDVLDVSRISTGVFQLAPEPVRPSLLVREAIESLQPAIAARGLQVTITARDGGVLILADPHRLRQVFWNLLSNAIKFTPVGGTVAVESRVSANWVEISVRDNGRGIAPAFLPHVFDMFRQADPSPTREVSGMGLGLNLVKRLTAMQGGEVSAHSDGEGRGATFTCRFPIHARSASPRESEQGSARLMN